jgi:hypothetical protein
MWIFEKSEIHNAGKSLRSNDRGLYLLGARNAPRCGDARELEKSGGDAT